MQKLSLLFSACLAGISWMSLASCASASAPPPMRESVAVCDPSFPTTNCMKPNADGTMPIAGSITVSPFPNYSLETGGNLAALAAAIGTPIPSNKTCQTTALAASLVCTPATALTDFAVTPDATLGAGAYFILILDATSAPTSPSTVVPKKCFKVPATYGVSTYGANFTAGGSTFVNGIVILPSVGADCQSYTASTHATFIQASYQ